jgi:hypothetical protein
VSSQDEIILLCEGFRDRAFWKGWLEASGCKDARRSVFTARYRWTTPTHAATSDGPIVGVHLWESPAGSLIHVVPCGSKEKVRKEAARILNGLETKPLRELILNVDPDGNGAERLQPTLQSLRSVATGGSETADGDYLVSGTTLVSPLLWYVEEPVPSEGVPEQQTLERLACTALATIHPDRAKAVQNWIQNRPAPNPHKQHKAFAWSYMAGWHADRECDEFYAALWTEPEVRAELEARLQKIGASRIVQRMLS